MSQEHTTSTVADPFGAMWAEWLKQVMPAGVTAPPPSKEVLDNLRRVFFDVLAGQAEQFMRSDAFLKGMKQATDQAVAWQRGINEMMQRNLAAAQIPSRADAEHLVALVRGMEERLLRKLDGLDARVGRIEKRRSEGP